jgi:hypothetical protein
LLGVQVALSFNVVMGNMSFIRTVTYGRADLPQQKNCTALTIRPVAGASVRTLNVTCTGTCLLACARACACVRDRVLVCRV